MSLVTFSFATLHDLPKIVETYNSTVPSRLVTADLEPVSVSQKLQWFNSHSNDKRPLWCVHYKNEYAGWMSFNSFYGRPAYNGTVEVSIYLEGKFRGKGLGKMCLQKAIDSCVQYKVNSLLGFIFGHNEPSLKLFYNFGFEKWAHLPKVANMDGIERDLIILGKRVQ
ncbi:MAG: Phosphinothricin N-acetyltransferase [Bacteroidetes bacterium]|jgi:phosphinothricin acetyltransferase|nr:Phosphinothricin N-acetyltransferase [Bacteroidota bacterium]